MYYIGNVRYFLKKKKFGDSAINEIVEKLEKHVVNNTKGDMGFVPVGSVRDVLDTDSGFFFTRDFQTDPMHLKIAERKGLMPEEKQMTDDEVLQRMIEIQKEYPKMFTHPEAKKNEIWIGDELLDFAIVNIGSYAEILPSARLSKESIMKPTADKSGNDAYRSILVDFEEFVRAELKEEKGILV